MLVIYLVTVWGMHSVSYLAYEDQQPGIQGVLVRAKPELGVVV